MKDLERKKMITVLVTVYNRQVNIERQRKFWEGSGIELIIIDSSKSIYPDHAKLPPNIKYNYFKEGRFYDIIHETLQNVATPYVIQINDDDFVLKSSLLNGISFLEKNSDYVSYQGSFMKFNEKAEHTHPFYCCRGINNFYKFNKGQENIDKRMALMQRSFVSPNHAIFRTTSLLSAYDLVKENERIQSIKYFDWIIGFVCTVKGKFHLSKDLFSIRSEERLITELGSSDYPAYLQREKRLTDLVKDDEALNILGEFMKTDLIDELPENRSELIRKHLNTYIALFQKGNFLSRLSWKLACLPFVFYNNRQIRTTYKTEVDELLDIVREQNS